MNSKEPIPVLTIQVGDIVKLNEKVIQSGFAGLDYNNEMRFEVLAIEDERGRSDITRVLTRLIGYKGDGIDPFPIYMLEKA
jgi:hypothetical protein